MSDRDLDRLANSFISRGVALESDFDSAADVERAAFSVITLYANWEEFSRRLVFASASARPFAAGGTRVVHRAPGVRNRADVESKLRQMKHTRPQFRLVVHLGAPTQMVKTCKFLQLDNEQVISPAILSQNSPADDLRLMRNFLAHQNPDTASQVSLSPPGQRIGTASTITWLHQKQAGGRSRFGVWVSDLSDVARACAN